jgi:hypothetical protein
MFVCPWAIRVATRCSVLVSQPVGACGNLGEFSAGLVRPQRRAQPVTGVACFDSLFEPSNISHANGTSGSQVGSQWPPAPSDARP